MKTQLCFIKIGRLKEAPQVRIKSMLEPFLSIESCKAWCDKHLFEYVIADKNGHILYRSN